MIILCAFDFRFEDNEVTVCAGLRRTAVGEAKRGHNSSSDHLSAKEEAKESALCESVNAMIVTSYDSKKRILRDEMNLIAEERAWLIEVEGVGTVEETGRE